MSSSILVATPIADPGVERLSEATLDRAAQVLCGIERRRRLDKGVAADLVFSGEFEAKRAALEAAFQGIRRKEFVEVRTIRRAVR